jgi:hypothetical protein
VRFEDRGGVFAVLNLSPQTQRVTFQNELHHGDYTEFFSGEAATFDAPTELALPPWSYRVYVRRPPA